MTLGQEIILYLMILPLFSTFLYALVDNFVEEYKKSKKIIRLLKKRNRKINEEIEKQDFYKRLGWR